MAGYGFGAKVKLTVDRSRKTEFNKQISDMVGQIKVSNKFTVLRKDMDRVRRETQAMLNSNPLILKVNKIDCSAAVTDVKRQLQTMLSALSVSNGVNIAGLKDFLGTDGMSASMRDTANAANSAITKMNEAQTAVARLAGQMEVLDTIAKSVASTYKRGTSGNGMIADEAEVQRITAAYNTWIQKVKEAKATRSGDIKALQQEGLAIQRNITALQNKQVEERKAQTAAEKASKAAEAAAMRAAAENEAELASLKQVATLQERMARFLRSNSKLSVSDSGAAIRAMLMELSSGAAITTERLREMEGTFANIRSQAIQTGVVGRTIFDSLRKAYEKFGGWMLITRSLTAAIHTIKKMITNVREIDGALTQLKIVTGATDKQLTAFLQNATVLAKNLGQSIKDVLGSIETFSRLGYNLADASELAEYATILSNVADVDTASATTGLTSIIKGYNMNVTEAEHVADVLVQVGQKYAVSASEMMEAYEKSGAALNATNTSFEKSAGLIAAANASVQNASTVGTALKTISARIRGATADLEALGEDTQDLAQGFSKYAEEIKALTGFDIMVDGSTDTYKDIYDIFDGLSKIWKDLSDTQQSRVAEILGGTRQLQVISSILGNWKDAAGAYSDAMTAAGTATQANETYMDSINGKIGVFNATFQEFSNTIFSSGLIEFFVQFGTAILSSLNALEKIHLLLPAIISIVVAINGIRAGLAAMRGVTAAAETASTINTIVAKLIAEKAATDALAVSVANLSIAEKAELATKIQAAVASGSLTTAEGQQILTTLGLATAEGTLTVANHTLGASFKALIASIPVWGWIALGVSALITAVTALSGAFKSNEERLAELNEEYDSLYSTIKNVSNEFKSLKTSADEVIPRFAELAKGVNKFGDNVSLTDEEYAEFLELNNRIAEMFPELNLGMDENGNYMLALAYGADTLTESLYELLEAQRLVAAQQLAATLPDLVDNVKEQERVYDKEKRVLQNRLVNYQEAYNAYASMFSDEVIANYKETFGDNWEAELNNAVAMMGTSWGTYIQEAFDSFNNADSWQRLLDKFSDSDGIIDWWGVLNSDEFKNVLAGIERELDNVDDKIQAKWNTINPAVNAWLQTDSTYNDMSEKMRTIARAMVSGLDFSGLGLTTAESIEDYITDYIINPLYNSGEDVRTAFANITDWQAELQDGEITFEEFSERIKSAFDGLLGTMSDDEAAAFANNFIAGFNAMGIAGNDFDTVINNIINSWGATTGAVSGNVATAIGDLAEQMTSLKDTYDLLKTAQEEVAGGEGLSVDTISKLAAAEENYLDYLYEENGVVKLNTAAWKENADAKAQGKVDALKKNLDELKAKSSELRANIKYYEKQQRGGNDGGLWSNQIAEATSALKENEEAIQDHEKELAIWEAAINSVQQSANSLVSVLNRLSTASGNIGKLSDALGSFAGNGSVSIDSLSSMSGVFGNLSSFESFVNIMSNSASSMKDAQDACNRLASEYIDMCGILDDVNAETAQLIERELEKMGVINAHEVVQARLNAVELEGVLAAKNLATASWEAASKILQESGASETAIASLQRLRQEQYNAKVAALDLATATAGATGVLIQQAQAAGVAANSIAALSRLQSLQEGGYAQWAQRGVTQSEYNAMLESARSAAQVDLANLSGISLPEVNLSVPAVGGGGSSSKKVEEYIANIDDYREALERLNRVQLRKDELELDLSNADDLREQIRLRQVLIGTYQDEQEAFHNLNTLRRKTLTDETDKLRQLGFEVEYDSAYNKFFVSNLEHLNELTANSKGKYDSLQEATNALREDTKKLIDSLESLNEDNQEASKSWVELKNSIHEAKISIIDSLKEIVSNASNAVDEIQNVYDTLHEAADEYAENGGFISIDAFQKIIELGPQYMQYLRDENGLLVINEENINKVITAKTRQLAAEQAVTYVERLRLALQKDSIEDLNTLLYATTEATNATFGLAYAELALMHSLGDLDDQQYAAALHNIQAIEGLANTAIASIGQTAGSYKEKLEEMKSGIDDILKYVMDMLKHRIQQQIDALEDLKDAYGDIIDLRKEALDVAKKEAGYEDKVAEKVKQLAKLQERINALSLDDSRDAQAQRIKLEEEMAELQKELADEQSDYAVDAQKEALDDMQEAYEKEKDAEIKALEETISSYQKLYDIAISYIENHWDTLYDELISWNTEYGNVLNSDITTAWENCLAAAQRYGSYVSALNSIDADISAAQSSGQNFIVGNNGSGSNSGNSNSSYSKDDEIHVRLAEMYRNSQAWHSASTSGREYLDKRNLQLGTELNALGIDAVRRGGTWYVGNELLFEKYGKYIYHKGGIAGDNPTLKQNEIMAILEEGEAVLDKKKESALYRIIDFNTALSEKLKRVVWPINLSGIFDIAKNGVDSTHAPLPSVTNNQNGNVHFGDVYIYGANEETVKQHQEINRKFTNEVLSQLHIKR